MSSAASNKLKSSELREDLLLAIGNPLLDIVAVADKNFLDRYNLKPNDAILADSLHKPMYEEMVEKFRVEYIAGGAAQNTARGTQWILGIPNVTSYFGCIGKDKFGAILKDKACEAGVNAHYMYDEKEATGTCAVLVTGQDRSLCAYLGAANCFKIAHIQKPENWAIVEKAAFYYLTGFFLTVSPDSMVEVCRHASDNNKIVSMNLSAPFLVDFFSEPMSLILPYVDIIFGNETEAATFSKKHNFGTENISEIALKICNLNKKNSNRSRMAVITQGPNPVVVAFEGKVTEYPVPKLSSEEIVDTNGAGDAFVGGFLAMRIQNKPIATCIRCAIYTAVQVIHQSGCTYPLQQNFEEESESL